MNSWAYDLHLEEDMKNGPFFLSPIENIVTNIWYQKGARIGIHTISHWLKNMAEEAGVERRVTNKSGRRTAITEMALANVPQKVMCQITGHKNPNSFDRYNDSLEVACKAAMKTIEPSIMELD